jgi:O-antigen/teichoic acid export membrane protein
MTRRAARDALVVTGGRIAFAGLWFTALLLVYRGLGKDEDSLADAGAFAAALACIRIASGIIVDAGDTALMRRAPGLLRDAPAQGHALVRAAMVLRLAAAVPVAAGVAALAAGFGRPLAGSRSIAALAGWIIAAILADMLFRSVVVVLQAQQRFVALVLLEGALQVARLGAILALLLAGAMTVEGVLAAYAGVALLGALGGAALLLPRALFASAAVDRADLRDLLGFLKWMVPAMVLSAVNDRLDVLLVYGVSGAEAAGRYGAMLTLAMVPDLVAGSVASVLLPRVAGMRAEGSYEATLRRYLAVALPLLGLCYAAAVLFAGSVVPAVLGAGYAPGIPVLLWLLAGSLFWLAVVPLPMSMVAVHAPAQAAAVTAAQSVMILAGGLALMSAGGPVGMAQAMCLMRVGVAIALLVLARRIASPRVLPAGGGGACADAKR